jgi:hemerythrin-like domain-containing protein
MPVVINARPERGFDDPIGLLGDCHRRIERFLSVLARVAAEGRGPLDAATGAAFENALRYFRDAAPKHTADEEHSLFPRLRQSGHPEAAAAAARASALERDHRLAVELHAQVDALGRAWLGSGALDSAEAQRLSRLLAGLAALYGSHIAAEDNEVFPVAARVLSLADRAAMGGEMAARRGLNLRNR